LSGIAEHGLADREEVKILAPHKRIVITDSNVSVFFECKPAVEEQIRQYAVAKQ
jgi:hypothetical protein